MNKRKAVCLIGLGRFGKEYYHELIALEKHGLLDFKGVIVKTDKKRDQFSKRIHIWNTHSSDLLIDSCDLAIVATPPEVHTEVISSLISRIDVLCEKPLTTSFDEFSRVKKALQSSKYNLYASQIFRHHPFVSVIEKIIQKKTIKRVVARYVNSSSHCLPAANDKYARLLIMNHMIDLVLYLFRDCAISGSVISSNNTVSTLMTRINSATDCIFDCGWDRSSTSHARTIFMEGVDESFLFDFAKDTLTVKANNSLKNYFPDERPSILRNCLRAMCIVDVNERLFSLDEHQSLVSIIEEDHQSSIIRISAASSMKRVAVIGAGVFGCTTAIELSAFSNVTLFEKSSSVLSGASRHNQLRHHSGFHYPLSFETAREIQQAKSLFESQYGDCIRFDIESYYAVSSKAHEIPPKRYLASCSLYGLNYEIVSPPKWFSPDSVSLCVRTDEGVYDIDKLAEKINNKIYDLPSITVKLNTVVTELSFTDCHIISSICNGARSEEEYDFVIDCSYGLADFTRKNYPYARASIRKELTEVLLLDLDIPPHCATVIDGPFCSLTSTTKQNKFILSHAVHSLHSRLYSEDLDLISETDHLVGLESSSNRQKILGESTKYFPFLKRATAIESIYCTKGISPFSSEVWERPTKIVNEGHGLYKIIGGKILTSVYNAKEIVQLISNS